MADFSKWLTGLSYWWILLGFVAFMTGLFFLFEMKDVQKGRTIFLVSLAALSVASVLLANTWAKKK